MRKWHRWLATVFGIFLFWIALTGFGIQLLDLSRGEKHEAPAAAAAPAGFTCPAGWSCKPARRPDPAHEASEFVKHLHSGEALGPLGVWISLASSIALLFFAVSGLWMYVRMFRARARNGAKRTLFW
ncbi:MAG: PepSY domain-containing protein [Candidatus Andeanibacterium colombiense]|uniref:PepSY domain-containing protein n=1 Tax=Candidatus Andeanibacterium colombiense TaxID=3121345 RepID=A0AAJ5X2B1_9SPHN|nr:MAG: PepSY domain-containing protein [Sphingomonadaceae bacterium]